MVCSNLRPLFPVGWRQFNPDRHARPGRPVPTGVPIWPAASQSTIHCRWSSVAACCGRPGSVARLWPRPRFHPAWSVPHRP